MASFKGQPGSYTHLLYLRPVDGLTLGRRRPEHAPLIKQLCAPVGQQ